jgi:hypothetical protein
MGPGTTDNDADIAAKASSKTGVPATPHTKITQDLGGGSAPPRASCQSITPELCDQTWRSLNRTRGRRTAEMFFASVNLLFNDATAKEETRQQRRRRDSKGGSARDLPDEEAQAEFVKAFREVIRVDKLGHP